MVNYRNIVGLLTESNKCCGCTACVEICPKKCLSMVENKEGFFVARENINWENCIHCNKCNKVCPIQNTFPEEKKKQYGFIIQNSTESIRIESTSGGAFSAIALSIIQQDGLVFGATFGADLNIIHTSISHESELYKFRGSKYIQSNLTARGGVFSEVKQYLKTGRLICFSGTPCQIEGLLSFLGKEYSNLITVDVVCHGIGSPWVWKKYLELMRQRGLNADYAYFRKKHYGYKYSTMSLMKDGKEIYYNGVESDPMLRAYFDNICELELCYSCPFKKRYRKSDITIWDCFSPWEYDKAFDDDKGTSKVLVHSAKGLNIVEDLIRKNYVRALAIAPDRLTHNAKEMTSSIKQNPKRSEFFNDCIVLSPEGFFNKWYPASFKTLLNKVVRILLVKFGIYQVIRRLYWRIG